MGVIGCNIGCMFIFDTLKITPEILSIVARIDEFKGAWRSLGLRSLAEQVRRLEKKVEREKLVMATLPELSLLIIEFAREHGRITIGDAIKLTGVSRNTLKQHFRNLVERNHLNLQGSGRGVWYELK